MPATSAERLEACLPYIFQGEGGYTNDRRDPGNWTGGKVGVGRLLGTKYGIAANSFPNLDIPNLTKAQAADIYRNKYWSTAGCDTLVAGVDLPIFDVSVNSGPGRANVFRTDTRLVADPVARIKSISGKRRAFYQGLKTFKTFGKGWMARVAKIEAAGIKMALAAVGASPQLTKTVLVKEAKASEAKVQTGSAAGGTAAVGTGGLTATAGVEWWQIGLGVAAVAVALAITIHFVRGQWERAEAFREEADALGSNFTVGA